MSTNKSQSLNLHLWEPQDNFLRTEFNENFAAIDSAVQSRDRSGRDELETLSYNLHRLMAQRDYDRQFQGAHRNFFVNTFRNAEDRSGTTGLSWNGTDSMLLGPQAQMDNDIFRTLVTENVRGGFYSSSSNHAKLAFTMGPLSAFMTHIYMYCNEIKTNKDFTLTGDFTFYKIADGKEIPLKTIRDFSVTCKYADISYGLGAFLFPVDLTLDALASYRIEYKCQHRGDATQYYFSHPDYAQHKLINAVFEQLSQTRAASTRSDIWSGAVSRAVGLVRHTGGTVQLSLNGKAMTRRASRTTVNCDGASCTETEFVLDNPGTGTMTIAFTMTCNAGETVKVHDYGVYALR